MAELAEQTEAQEHRARERSWTLMVATDQALPAADVVMDALIVGLSDPGASEARRAILTRIRDLIRDIAEYTDWTSRAVLLAVGCEEELHTRSAQDAEDGKLEALERALTSLAELASELYYTCGDPAVTGSVILEAPKVLELLRRGRVDDAYVEAVADRRLLSFDVSAFKLPR